MTLGLILDGLLIILILILIGYCIKLNERLKNFKEARGEMTAVIGQLNMAISQSQKSIAHLKETVLDEEGRLTEGISQAQAMKYELNEIIQTGEGLASRISDGLVPSARGGRAKELSDDNEIREALKNLR